MGFKRNVVSIHAHTPKKLQLLMAGLGFVTQGGPLNANLGGKAINENKYGLVIYAVI